MSSLSVKLATGVVVAIGVVVTIGAVVGDWVVGIGLTFFFVSFFVLKKSHGFINLFTLPTLYSFLLGIPAQTPAEIANAMKQSKFLIFPSKER
jgi:hypothetical protein